VAQLSTLGSIERMKTFHVYIIAAVALVLGIVGTLYFDHHDRAATFSKTAVTYEHRLAASALTTLISLRSGDTNAAVDSLEHQLDGASISLSILLDDYPDIECAINYRSTLHNVAAYRNQYPHHSNDTNLDEIVAAVLAKASK
jgi:hypothetical protein